MNAPLRCLSLATAMLTCSAVAAQPVAEAPASATKGSAAKGSAAKGSATKTTPIKLAGGALSVDAPAAWKQIKPRNRIIEVELAVPADNAAPGSAAKGSAPKGSASKGSGAKGSAAKGSGTKASTARLTIMAAGGSVDQNLARWIGQFQGTAGGAAREKAKTDKREVAGMTLHTLDIDGTYMDSMRGPFGPKVAKPDHRMIAGILQTKGQGTYFFKLVGPKDIVSPNAESFQAMLDSVEAAK